MLWKGAFASGAAAQIDRFAAAARGTGVCLSGYRCAAHNRAGGGAGDSYYLFGMAADIWSEGVSPQQLAKIAENIGFDGVGVYPSQGFVHVDVRRYKARW